MKLRLVCQSWGVTVDLFWPAETSAKKDNILRENSSIVVTWAPNHHQLILHRKSRGKIHMFWTEELAWTTVQILLKLFHIILSHRYKLHFTADSPSHNFQSKTPFAVTLVEKCHKYRCGGCDDMLLKTARNYLFRPVS